MWEVILAIIVISFTAFYFHVKYKMSYWRRHGVAEDPGFFPFGGQHIWDMLTEKTAFTEMTKTVYFNHPNEKVVGTYEMFGDPGIVIRDIDIGKLVLIKDFDQFAERKPTSSVAYKQGSKNNKYLPQMLVELRGSEWKRVRSSLTPAFTSGKLKAMVPLIHRVLDNCDNLLEKTMDDNLMDTEEIMRNFSMDVIISTGFGYECDSFNDPENIFKKQADKMFGKEMKWDVMLGMMMFIFAPKLLGWLDWRMFDKEAEDFFSALIMKTIAERQASGEKRNDLIDICLDILKKEENLSEGDEGKMKKEEMDTLLISNSLMMFLAGFETVTGVGSMIMYFMAKNPECQQKLYEELNKAVEENGDSNFDYQTIMNMPYLEMVFQECQRMYPLGHIERASVNDYKIPGTDVVIPKDIFVRVPISEFCKDEKFFPNPEVFNPENFTAENKANRSPLASGGFGHGPRNCIAQRFATMEVKLLVGRLLHKYRVEPCSKTVESLVPDPKSRSFLPKGGVWVKLEKR